MSPSAPTDSPDPATALPALAAAARAEEVAGFGYGQLGPRLTAGDQLDLARACELAHRVLATTATAMAAAAAPNASAAPSVPGSADPLGHYQLPVVPVDAGSARQLAVYLEQSCASAWRYLLAQLADTSQASAGGSAWWPIAAAALRDSAVRAAQWRRAIDPGTATVPFPGI